MEPDFRNDPPFSQGANYSLLPNPTMKTHSPETEDVGWVGGLVVFEFV